MTISAFCHDQLLAQGPLSLDILATLAVDAGKTTARNPAASVRSAIEHRAVLLADGRWATPLWLLEGRILTARRLPLVRGWSAREDEGDVPPYAYLHEEPGALPDGTHHDLALLESAAKAGSLPLADGGLLRIDRYGGGWRAPEGWPQARPGSDQLVGLRVRQGQLHVELVAVTDELHGAGRRLADELGPLDTTGSCWGPEDRRVSGTLSAALWNRMAADASFLTAPVPPFSRCIPPLALALRRERDRRAAEASRWRPQVELPAGLQRIAVQAAWRSDQLLDDWLNAFVSRALRELDEHDTDWLDGYGDVLPLERRR